ncbi:hypothetical protein SADUNF_Sadunf07G0005000 [Salix dunnii]|uniref:Uncharacterized protein n=1 Tax=Salix dunnii TaxID=1413687 RepID=A0A835JVC0_9ROSI|nr:hypothetical protein SADUNF_Sadunf07G0005000 [Salix dunnii]
MAPLFQHSNTQSTRAASSGDLSDSTILLPQATSNINNSRYKVDNGVSAGEGRSCKSRLNNAGVARSSGGGATLWILGWCCAFGSVSGAPVSFWTRSRKPFVSSEYCLEYNDVEDVKEVEESYASMAKTVGSCLRKMSSARSMALQKMRNEI